MPYLKLIALPCRVAKGAFSDEIIFEVDLPNGGEPYMGAASRQYCWNQNNQKLDLDEPHDGQMIKGKIAARLLELRGQQALVAIPDGEVITVRAAQILDRPPEKAHHVPVQSCIPVKA
jgi:hypothetical protein